MTNTKQVPVYKGGKIVGHVSEQATSVSASKLAGAPCGFNRVDGQYAWVAK
jgi:hypothetical protein